MSRGTEKSAYILRSGYTARNSRIAVTLISPGSSLRLFPIFRGILPFYAAQTPGPSPVVPVSALIFPDDQVTFFPVLLDHFVMRLS